MGIFMNAQEIRDMFGRWKKGMAVESRLFNAYKDCDITNLELYDQIHANRQIQDKIIEDLNDRICSLEDGKYLVPIPDEEYDILLKIMDVVPE